MHEKVGTHYHWIPELYRRMKLPVFDGVQEALQRYNIERKRRLAEIKTNEHKKRRVQSKIKRTQMGKLRAMWSLKHGRHTYGHDEDDLECGVDVVAKGSRGEKPQQRRCKACGLSTHQRSNHKDCPSNKGRGATTSSQRGDTSTNDMSLYADLEHESASDNSVLSDVSDVSCLEDDIIDNVSSVQCTCGADGRAHKKGCPMNSRNRYPGRSLFPTMPDYSLEPPADKCNPGESCKAPPAKRRKVNMKVGDYVCIHHSSMGKYHLPCRIVGCFGDKYQVYCSKGILNTSIPGSELIVPLSKCLSIQLHKWRLAPRVSLKSVVSDPAVTECCDCSFPKSSKCTVILSSSEDEDEGVGRGIWVKNELYSLTNDDREMVASPKWLTDKIITAAQMLILQHFPSMSGLQPPCVQHVLAFKVHSGEFIQIVHVRNNHWCVVSTVGCENGVVNVYDSLYPSVSMKTITLIASMVFNSLPKLVVRMMDVEKQSNGADCGVLAIAYMYVFDICSGFDPCQIKFDHRFIRQHLVTCFENCQFQRFPVLGERKNARVKFSKSVELHCSCRMPEQPGDEMVECDSCHVWYHRHCMDIPSEVFGVSEVSWKCKAC